MAHKGDHRKNIKIRLAIHVLVFGVIRQPEQRNGAQVNEPLFLKMGRSSGHLIKYVAHGAGFLHHAQESASELINTIILAEYQSFKGKKFRADPDRGRTGRNEVKRRKLIDPAGDDQLNLREWNLQCFHVLNTTGGLGWKDIICL